MLESIFGPRLPEVDQYLNYISKRPRGSSPIDYKLMSKSYLVTRSPAENFLRCAFNGVATFTALMFLGDFTYTLANDKVYRSIYPQDNKDICQPCDKSMQKVLSYIIGSCRFFQRNNLYQPDGCKGYTDTASTGFSFLDKGVDWAASTAPGLQAKFECLNTAENNSFGGAVEKCKSFNMVSSFLEGGEILAIPLAVTAGIISLYSFLSSEGSRHSLEQQIISKLSERYQMVSDKLLQEYSQVQGEALLEQDVKDKAASIMNNKSKMIEDVEKLQLPSLLVYENKLAILKPVFDACQEILKK